MSLNYETYRGSSSDILNRYFTPVFRPGYVTVNGIIMPENFKKLGDNIYNMEVYKSDVWVCSFPKCGTTWTQEMVWMIANDLDFEGAETVLAERFPFLEVTALFDYSEVKKKHNGFKFPDLMEDSFNFVKNLKGRRFLKTHLPWVLLPKQIQNNEAHPKIIYVSRNPKDTCVSYYHHCRLMEGYSGGFEDFCKLFLEGKLCFAPYWDHVLYFWERRNQPNILFIRYEDMKNDLDGVIKKVAEFLEKDLTEEQMTSLVKHLSFESMKNNKSVNYESVIDVNRKLKIIETEGCFMRSGSVGEFKAIMTPEIIKKFDEMTEKKFGNTGLNY